MLHVSFVFFFCPFRIFVALAFQLVFFFLTKYLCVFPTGSCSVVFLLLFRYVSSMRYSCPPFVFYRIFVALIIDVRKKLGFDSLQKIFLILTVLGRFYS